VRAQEQWLEEVRRMEVIGLLSAKGAHEMNKSSYSLSEIISSSW